MGDLHARMHVSNNPEAIEGIEGIKAIEGIEAFETIEAIETIEATEHQLSNKNGWGLRQG